MGYGRNEVKIVCKGKTTFVTIYVVLYVCYLVDATTIRNTANRRLCALIEMEGLNSATACTVTKIMDDSEQNQKGF